MLFSKNSEQKGRLLDKYQTDSMDKKCAKVTSNDSTNNKVKPKHHHYQSIY